MTSRGFGVRHAPPAEFASFMARDDAELGALMKMVGWQSDWWLVAGG